MTISLDFLITSTPKWKPPSNLTKLSISSKMILMCCLKIRAIKKPLSCRIPSNRRRIFSIWNRRGRKCRVFSFSRGCRGERIRLSLRSLFLRILITIRELSFRWNHQNLSFFSGITKICTQSILFSSSAHLSKSLLSNSTPKILLSSLLVPSMVRLSFGISKMFS